MGIGDPQPLRFVRFAQMLDQHHPRRLDRGELPFARRALAQRRRQVRAAGKIRIAAFEQAREQVVDLAEVLLGKGNRRAGRATGEGQRRLARARLQPRARRIDRAREFAGPQRVEAQDAAARTHGRQQPPEPMGHQQEHRARRRLLEALEQRVDGALLEVVRRIDDQRAPGAERRPRDQAALHLAHLIDRDAALPGEWLPLGLLPGVLFGRGERLEHRDVGVRFGMGLGHAGLGNVFRRSPQREARLAQSLAPRQDPRVVHPRAALGRPPGAPGFVVSEK